MNRKKEIMNVSVEDKNRPLQIEDQNEKWQWSRRTSVG